MMLYVVTLFCVHDPAAEQRLITSLRIGGEWHALARAIAPQLIATDLLRHQHYVPTPLYLCLDFWTSAEAYQTAIRSTDIQQVLQLRREMASSSFELGAFAFPRFTGAVRPSRMLVH